MNVITKSLYKWHIQSLLSKACPKSIPTSGIEGEKVNCFYIYFCEDSDPTYVVMDFDGNKMKAMKYENNRFSKEVSLLLSETINLNLKIVHHYGLDAITYHSIYDLNFNRSTHYEYFKIKIRRWINSVNQYFFNKKKIVTVKKIELLKFMLSNQLDSTHEGIDTIDLMTKLYSINWVMHPDGNKEERKLQLYLDALVDSGDLAEINHEYVVQGKAISSIQLYEEEERRHTENVIIQRKMLWLTIFIIFLTLVQSGLIKFPILYDFTSK